MIARHSRHVITSMITVAATVDIAAIIRIA